MEKFAELITDFANALFVPDWPITIKVAITILALKGIFSRWI